ncbi:protein kinase [Halomicrobium sp. LC1Hm]|uniref:protein kinase domain-containing protein n=1 Tax=Halomicrobium sp. LC1Hm TaxID=2610902 RepID=UPI0012982BB7|nr:protein kinase [Halomicrobium sp. LC1Hm]
MTDSEEEETPTLTEIFETVESEAELTGRNLTVLRTVLEREPAGITDLAEVLDHPHHELRYSLRVLEEENLIEPTAEGAVTTGDVVGSIEAANAGLEELQSGLRACAAAFGSDEGQSSEATEADALEGERRTEGTAGRETEQAEGQQTTDASPGEASSESASTAETASATETESAAENTDETESTAATEASADAQSSTATTVETASKVPDVASVQSPAREELAYADFEIEEQLGHGGSGVVHEAQYRVDGEPTTVALKVPNFEGTITSSVIEDFEQEAETWSLLSPRDHVVGVVDSGTQPKPWIAMEYMDGGTLRERLSEFSIEQAVWTCERIAQGVRHDQTGVLHLDLKPENVLFRRTGEGSWDVPKIADWGLARTLKEHQPTVEGMSPTYAAPEQFDAEEFGDPSSKTDIYQLGVLMYEVLTGRPPFEGNSVALMNAILTEEPEPPAAVDDRVPQAVSDAVMKALRKEPAERFSTVERLQSQLRAQL